MVMKAACSQPGTDCHQWNRSDSSEIDPEFTGIEHMIKPALNW